MNNYLELRKINVNENTEKKGPNSFSGYKIGPLVLSYRMLKIAEQSWKY